MPRINVSDDEVRLLETLRAKRAGDLGFNEGLDAARAMVRTFMEGGQTKSENWGEDLDRVLQAERRKISL